MISTSALNGALVRTVSASRLSMNVRRLWPVRTLRRNAINVVKSDLVNVDEFANVRSVRLNSQGSCDFVGHSDVEQLRIGLDVKGNSTLLVG